MKRKLLVRMKRSQDSQTCLTIFFCYFFYSLEVKYILFVIRGSFISLSKLMIVSKKEETCIFTILIIPISIITVSEIKASIKHLN